VKGKGNGSNGVGIVLMKNNFKTVIERDLFVVDRKFRLLLGTGRDHKGNDEKYRKQRENA
jgi:GTP-sensing pleiotropic transcriptional regulator CodY